MNQELQKRVRGMLGGLSTQFVLGMVLNLFGQPPDSSGVDHSPLWTQIAFYLHGLLGLALLIGAILVYLLSNKSGNKTYKSAALYGLLSILLAAFGGVLTVVFGEQDLGEFSSFLMAIGFLLSFISYGRLYLLISKNS